MKSGGVGGVGGREGRQKGSEIGGVSAVVSGESCGVWTDLVYVSRILALSRSSEACEKGEKEEEYESGGRRRHNWSFLIKL